MATTTATIGANVRAEMARRNLRQQQVADALGLTQSRVSTRLRGRTEWSASELVRVAILLGVPVSVLLADSPVGPAEVDAA